MNVKEFLMKWYSSRSLVNKICIWIVICLTFLSAIFFVISRNTEYLVIIGGLWIFYVLFYFLLKGEIIDTKDRWKSFGFILKSSKDWVKKEIEFWKNVKNKKEKKKNDL